MPILIAGIFAGAWSLLTGVMATLWASFLAMIPLLIVYVFTFLGIASVTYTGLSIILGQLQSSIQTQIGNLPAEMIGLLHVANVDVAITMIVSFIVFKKSIGLTSSYNKYKIVHGGAP